VELLLPLLLPPPHPPHIADVSMRQGARKMKGNFHASKPYSARPASAPAHPPTML
jgi:hypothetical protein